MGFKFSVVMAIYNSDLWLETAIESLINQSLDFKKNIEVILVNDGSTDGSEDICLNYRVKYPKNFKYVSNKENKGPAASRNEGLKHASGEIINFLDSDDYISMETFRNVYNFFRKYKDEIDIVSIPIYFFEDKKGSHILNFKFKNNNVVNLLENPEYIQLSSSSSFFKREALENVKFNPKLITSEDVVLINQLLLKNPKIGYCNKGKYLYRKRFTKSSIIDSSLDRTDYFIERIRFYFNFLINESLSIYGEIPLFIQYTIMYDLQWIFDINKIDSIFSSEEISYVHRKLYLILQNIDDEVIYNQKHIPNHLIAHILYFKHQIEPEDKKFLTNTFINLNLNTIFIDIFEIDNENNLYICGNFMTYLTECEVFILINGEKLSLSPLNFPQRDKYSLNEKYSINQSFEIDIPLDISKKTEIQFISSIPNLGILDIDFSRPCRFSKVGKYARSQNFISILNDNKILIKKITPFNVIKNEIITLSSMISHREQGYRTGIPIRLAYTVFNLFFRWKELWLFMDLPKFADDNGIALFKYANAQNDGIKKYFVLDKDSKDYDKMKAIGKVIPHKSIKNRFIALFATKLITSHPDNPIIYPFWGNYPFFSGLLKSKTIFLQHGITKDNVSSWLKKYDKNFALFVTASKRECESIFEFPYNYNKDIVKLLGFPRFDSLERKEDKKQIIIMPSWRRYIHKKPKKYILQSEYYIKFNSLINNPRLIKIAKKYGYEIIFKPHPNVYRFIDLFETNDYVKIDFEYIRYQELFNHASLLITDYSSVAFDFAYLKKPVLYYHYAKDYHFDIDDSYFNYETMGFGEVLTEEDELIDLIEEYLKNNCQLKEKYEENIGDFFYFTDKNNCKRVYEEILKIK